MKYFEITRYKYELAETDSVLSGIPFPDNIDNDEFSIFKDGTIVAKKGYLWDGPSGPTWDRKENMRASLFHDVLAEAMRQGLISQAYWIPANDLLGRICVEDGMWPWWAINVYVRGVSLTNNWCRVTGEPEHPILEAP